MQRILFLLSFYFLQSGLFAQHEDTMFVKAADLRINQLQTGTYSYLVYNKQDAHSAALHLTLVKMNIQKNSETVMVTQQWESADTVIHSAYTVLDSRTLATRIHNTWWKRLGYEMRFNFITKTVEFSGAIPDSSQQKIRDDFNRSIAVYSLNWHSDLVIFSLLPYALHRTFLINYFDPGFGPSQKVAYTVETQDELKDNAGNRVDCWVLVHKPRENAYQKFWVSKKTNEILKEEDFFGGRLRYKLKLGVAADF